LSELIDTSAPPSRSRGAACLITKKEPVRQTSTTERKSSTGNSVINPTVLKPAVLTTMSSTGVIEQCPHRILVGDVDRHGAVRIAEFCGDGVRAAGVAVRDDHPMAVRGQRMRHRLADARGAADDDSGLFGHSGCAPFMELGHLALITPHGSA
jgi:hypothetical protein